MRRRSSSASAGERSAEPDEQAKEGGEAQEHSVLFYTIGDTCVMRPLRYSINVTVDGCCDHRAVLPDEELVRHHAENLGHADALLFGRVTYKMMEAGWRQPVPAGARPEWMESFARTINTAKKYVVSSTLDRVDWNAELASVNSA